MTNPFRNSQVNTSLSSVLDRSFEKRQTSQLFPSTKGVGGTMRNTRNTQQSRKHTTKIKQSFLYHAQKVSCESIQVEQESKAARRYDLSKSLQFTRGALSLN